jgi:predicted NBD/HSP70 family sugar kinase
VTRDTSVRVLRQANRAAVLRHVILAGETTRSRVGDACGLSVGSVTNVVNDLLDEGLIEETGSMPSGAGRPTTLLSPRAEGAYFVGVDVGEQGVAVELFDLRMNRVDREFARADSDSLPEPAAIAAALTAAVTRVWSRHPDLQEGIAGIGLGLPGVVEAEPGGDVLYAQTLGWPRVEVADLLDVSGLGDVAVYAANGAKTLAAAENAFGAARGAERAVVALLGRGVGLGVLQDGHLLAGRAGTAAEWGHTRVALRGRRCACGGSGCLEAYVGAEGILGRWREAGGEPDGHGWNALGALVEAAAGGDDAAGRVLDETVEILGLGLGSVVNLYNPERLVIGGWVGLRLMESRAAAIEVACRDSALPHFASQLSVQPCAFGGDSVALGSALLPLEHLIDPPTARTFRPDDGRHQHVLVPTAAPSKEMS